MGNIKWSILNAAELCAYCEEPLSKKVALPSDDLFCLFPEGEPTIEAQYNGHKYIFHKKCFIALEVAVRINQSNQ